MYEATIILELFPAFFLAFHYSHKRHTYGRLKIGLIQCNGTEWMRNHNHKHLIIQLVIRRQRVNSQSHQFHAAVPVFVLRPNCLWKNRTEKITISFDLIDNCWKIIKWQMHTFEAVRLYKYDTCKAFRWMRQNWLQSSMEQKMCMKSESHKRQSIKERGQLRIKRKGE